jgi:hypothetical protein
MHVGHRLKICLILCSLLLPHPASAFEDKATGLKVEPPSPYTAEATKRPGQAAVAGIKASTGKPATIGTSRYNCEIAYMAAEANAGMSQADLNARITSEEWRGMAIQAVERALKDVAASNYDLSGYTGIELIGTPKTGPDADKTRMILSISETAKGRVTMSCAVNSDEFDAALKDFRAIRATITLPQ